MTEPTLPVQNPDAFTQEIHQIYNNLNSFAKFFFPKELKLALEGPNKNDDKTIKEAFSYVTTFERVLFPGLGRLKFSLGNYQPIEDEVEKLVKDYNERYRARRLFFPGPFKKAIQKENRNPLEVIQVLHQNIYFYHRIFFSPLMGKYFRSRTAQSVRWLFDANSIPSTEVGKDFSNALGDLERDWQDKIVDPISTLETYFNSHPNSQFFMPKSLSSMLLTPSKSDIQKYPVQLTLAVFRMPWYYKLLLNIFYPSMLKSFTTNEHIKGFFAAIERNTTLPGNLRVKRNFETLALIKEKAIMANKEHGRKVFSERIDCEIANLIGSLNVSGSQNANINAQRTLDLIRSFESNDPDNLDILHVCDAISLYFKNYDKNDGNHKLREIVEKFKQDPNWLRLYRELRNEHVDLFVETDPISNREKLDAVLALSPNSIENASISFRLLANHALINKSSLSRDQNFNDFIRFQKNEGFDLKDFNDELIQLETSLKTLHADIKINQALFETCMNVSKGNVVSLMKRITQLFNEINQTQFEEAQAQDLYLDFTSLLEKTRQDENELFATLNALEVVLKSKTIDSIPLLLKNLNRAESPLQVLSNLIPSTRPATSPTAATSPTVTPATEHTPRTEAQNSWELAQGLIQPVRRMTPYVAPFLTTTLGIAGAVYYIYPSIFWAATMGVGMNVATGVHQSRIVTEVVPQVSAIGAQLNPSQIISALTTRYQTFQTPSFQQGMNWTSQYASYFYQLLTHNFSNDIFTDAQFPVPPRPETVEEPIPTDLTPAATPTTENVPSTSYYRSRVAEYLFYQNSPLERAQQHMSGLGQYAFSFYQGLAQKFSHEETQFPVSSQVEILDEPTPVEQTETPPLEQEATQENLQTRENTAPFVNRMISTLAIFMGVVYMLYEIPSRDTLNLGASLLSNQLGFGLNEQKNQLRIR